MHKIHEGYETYKKRLEKAVESGSAKEVCDLSEVVKNLGKVLLIDDELESGMEHQTSQRSYRSMPYYYGSGVDPGRDEVSYRRGRDSMGRYTSRRGMSYGDDGERTAKIIKKMMRDADGEEREVLEKCLDMTEQYA
jgi:hypothetical protein